MYLYDATSIAVREPLLRFDGLISHLGELVGFVVPIGHDDRSVPLALHRQRPQSQSVAPVWPKARRSPNGLLIVVYTVSASVAISPHSFCRHYQSRLGPLG
jgi:hypothetical protein